MKYRVKRIRERIRWLRPEEIEKLRAKEEERNQQLASETVGNLSKSMSEKPIKLNTITLMDLRDQEYMFQKEVDNREITTFKFQEEPVAERNVGIIGRIKRLFNKV